MLITKEQLMKYWYVLLIVVTLIIFVGIAFTMGTYHPQSSLVTKLVDDQVKLEKQKFDSDLEALKKKYTEEISQMNVQLNTLQINIEKSNSKFMTAQKTIESLKKELNLYVLPKNMGEAKKMLSSLGYTSF